MKGGKKPALSARAADPAGSELQTDRTLMRHHTVADFEQSAELWSDPEVVHYISGKPSTRAESWTRLLRYIGHWQALSFGYWVVEDRLTGQFLGEVGLADYKRDMTPSIEQWPEIGWVLAPHAQGRGLATEAIAAALAWSDRTLTADRTMCLVDPDHAASIGVAAKNGFVERCSGELGGSPVLIMERLKPAT